MSVISKLTRFFDWRGSLETSSDLSKEKVGDPFWPVSRESIAGEVTTNTDLIPPLASIVADYLNPKDSDAGTMRLIDKLPPQISDLYEESRASNRRPEREQREMCAKVFFEQFVHLTRSQFEKIMDEGAKSDVLVPPDKPSYYTPGYGVIGPAKFQYKVDYIKHEAFSWAIDHINHPFVQPLRDSFQYLLDYCNINCKAQAKTVSVILNKFYNKKRMDNFPFIDSRMPVICLTLAQSLIFPRKSERILLQELIKSGAVQIPKDLWEGGCKELGYD